MSSNPKDPLIQRKENVYLYIDRSTFILIKSFNDAFLYNSSMKYKIKCPFFVVFSGAVFNSPLYIYGWGINFFLNFKIL